MKIRNDVPKVGKAAARQVQKAAAQLEAKVEEKKSGWTPKAAVRGTTGVNVASQAQRATDLNKAFDKGDTKAALALLKGGTAESNAALATTYREKFGKDLEWDMRGFPPTVKGLEGASLKQGFDAFYGPKAEKNAARIAELTKASPAGTAEGRKELYTMLSTLGGEERQLLDTAVKKQTGKSLADVLRPVTAAQNANEKPLTTDPKKTVAIVVSSGNWKDIVDGKTDTHKGGYHWREIEGYVKEALEQGFTPVIYTPDGLPPSPDALSLLQGKLGPAVGFGLREGTGPESKQGQAIMNAFAEARSLKDFDPDDFATLHIAGGHGSPQDLVSNTLVESAATKMHEQGKVITAVCHATPALGKLLKGGNATGFSPQIDQMNAKAGFILPEFIPPYDAHKGLRDLGAKFNVIDTAQALANINHTETFNRNGTPIITGTGPEATDNVAREALKWLKANQ